MVDLRIRLSALGLVAVVIGTNGAALLAAERQHAACVTQHHECDKTVSIRPCCCDAHDDASNQGGPVETRVQVGADASAVPVALATATLSDSPHLFVRVHASPPLVIPLDLPTRFAALLI